MNGAFDELLALADKMVWKQYPNLTTPERAKLAVELCKALAEYEKAHAEYEKAHAMAIRTDRGI